MSIQLQVKAPSEREIQWELVAKKIADNFPELDARSMKVKQFTAGYSNLTYLLQFPNKEMVLRRPPFGEIPPKAHNMEREYRILEKIHPYFPQAPAPYLYVEDDKLMDKHFYVMEKKEGIVLDDHIPAEATKQGQVGEKASTAMIKTITQLHSIDIKQTGLIELGRPDGYLKRQVEGWIRRYERSKVEEHPYVEQLIPWFLEHLPAESPAPTVVHNDLKLNNMMLHHQDLSDAVAVFDWELCSVGDPLSDLASSVAYWTEQGDKETGLTSVTHHNGFMSRREFVERYANETNRNVDQFDYYLSFAFFKIAVILQQIYYRWKKGEINDDRFSNLNIGISNLIEQSHRAKERQII
ncbi:phosphotransferase family protein [Bacillus tianshenii]|nr:phosphotransferase family protein [Bacillus tianshenii]